MSPAIRGKRLGSRSSPDWPQAMVCSPPSRGLSTARDIAASFEEMARPGTALMPVLAHAPSSSCPVMRGEFRAAKALKPAVLPVTELPQVSLPRRTSRHAYELRRGCSCPARSFADRPACCPRPVWRTGPGQPGNSGRLLWRQGCFAPACRARVFDAAGRRASSQGGSGSSPGATVAVPGTGAPRAVRRRSRPYGSCRHRSRRQPGHGTAPDRYGTGFAGVGCSRIAMDVMCIAPVLRAARALAARLLPPCGRQARHAARPCPRPLQSRDLRSTRLVRTVPGRRRTPASAVRGPSRPGPGSGERTAPPGATGPRRWRHGGGRG